MDIVRVTRRMAQLPGAGLGLALAAPEVAAGAWRSARCLLDQAGDLLARIEALLTRAEQRVDEFEALLHRARPLEAAAAETVSDVRVVTARIEETRALATTQVRFLQSLLEEHGPLLRALAPMATQAAHTLHPRHLAGVAALLDQLPQLVDRIEPALTGMAGLAPEIGDVTARIDNVAKIVEGVPGAKALRRRGEARTDDR